MKFPPHATRKTVFFYFLSEAEYDKAEQDGRVEKANTWHPIQTIDSSNRIFAVLGGRNYFRIEIRNGGPQTFITGTGFRINRDSKVLLLKGGIYLQTK